MRNERGMVLVIAMVVALISATGTYMMLNMAASQTRWMMAMTKHERARYLSEAGIVWATRRIWQNPAFCTAGPQAVTLPEGTIEVTVTNCAVGSHRILARSLY